MKQQGFTIVELLGVVILLALLYFLFVPATINLFQRSTIVIDQATEDIIISQTRNYVESNLTTYPMVEGNIFCIPLLTLIQAGYLGDYLYDASNFQEYNENKIIEVVVAEELEIYIIEDQQCEVYTVNPGFIDQSGANPPILKNQMIPVYWNSGWIVADRDDDWYNYKEKRWANAVLVKSEHRAMYINSPDIMIDDNDILAHFVWIPRYRYKIFNSHDLISEREVNIQFEHRYIKKSSGEVVGQWLTHPAFSQNNRELHGFWVGKFITTGTNAVPTILPNSTMLRSNNMSTQFDIAKLIGSENYGLNFDSKIMRNTEWGAVAYLAHSKYGIKDEIWVNPNSNYQTGCVWGSVNQGSTSNCEQYHTVEGVLGSTTGTVYGVYDMSGGAWERVLGVMLDSDGENIQELQAGFGNILNNEEFLLNFDIYQYGTSSTHYQRRILGDSSGETAEWYDNMAVMPYGGSYSWFLRGGDYSMQSAAGIFAFATDSGNAAINTGFRITIPIY